MLASCIFSSFQMCRCLDKFAAQIFWTELLRWQFPEFAFCTLIYLAQFLFARVIVNVVMLKSAWLSCREESHNSVLVKCWVMVEV